MSAPYNTHSSPYKKRSPAWWVFLPIGLVVGFMLGFLPNFLKKDPSQPDSVQETAEQTATSKKPVMAVEAVRPVMAAVKKSLPASGVVAPKDVAEVGARVSGVAVTAVLVDVGDYVKAGQVLARLDDETARQEVAAAEAELLQAQAALAKASADVVRIEPLIEIDAISREQYDSYHTAKIQAEANVKALNARLNRVKTSQTNTAVIAPISGVVSEKNAEVGMMTTGGALFSLIKNGVLEWQASVSPSDAAFIGIGQVAQLNVGDKTVTATVTRLSPVANNSREVTVHATLEPNPWLIGGMYQTGQFLLSEQTVPTLPYRLITSSDGVDFVWVLTPTQTEGVYTARRQMVSLGERAGANVAVDLSPETLVVAGGGNFLSDGDNVRLVGLVTEAADGMGGKP
ncbi:MAG: efflux RND transporter periplasmic adaptor subunit [Moraxella sp.]|nr:efflux RND transporter periplasmic adaptor subunit [Moraxella sp.]